jgi:hypothetical protein
VVCCIVRGCWQAAVAREGDGQVSLEKRKPHDREWSRSASKGVPELVAARQSSGVGGSQGTLVKQVDNARLQLLAA